MRSAQVKNARNFIFVTDRYFTGVKLLEAVRRAGHHLVGTIKSGRGVVKELLWPRGSKLPRWTASFMRSWGDGDMLLQSWQDRGHVHVYVCLVDRDGGVYSSRMWRSRVLGCSCVLQIVDLVQRSGVCRLLLECSHPGCSCDVCSWEGRAHPSTVAVHRRCNKYLRAAAGSRACCCVCLPVLVQGRGHV